MSSNPSYLLEAPERPAGGPDGQGWNRLSIASCWTPSPQCALRPTTYQTFWESHHRLRAAWGNFSACFRQREYRENGCAGCPMLAHRKPLHSFTDRVLVRYIINHPNAYMRQFAHLMNHPERGWESRSQWWYWTDLRHVEGWHVGEDHRDEDGDGFWLIRDKAHTA